MSNQYYHDRAKEDEEEALKLMSMQVLFQGSKNDLGAGAVLAVGCEIHARKAMQKDAESKAAAQNVDKMGRRFNHRVIGDMVENSPDTIRKREGDEKTDLSQVGRKLLSTDEKTGEAVYYCPFYDKRLRVAMEAVRLRFNQTYRTRTLREGRALPKSVLENRCCPCLGTEGTQEYQTPEGRRYECLAEKLIGSGAVAYRMRQSAQGKTYRKH